MPESRRPNPDDPVARYIRARRLEMGLHQVDLSSKWGRARGSIGRLERGYLPGTYTADWVLRISDLLDVPPEVFIMHTGLDPALLPPAPDPRALSPARRALLALLEAWPEDDVERVVRVVEALAPVPPPAPSDTGPPREPPPAG